VVFFLRTLLIFALIAKIKASKAKIDYGQIRKKKLANCENSQMFIKTKLQKINSLQK